MSAIDDYNTHKEHLRRAERWAALHGAKYLGGGGGYGRLTSCEVKATIYHQEYNGANNYHESPPQLNIYLAKAIKKNFAMLLGAALSDMREETILLATHAEKVYKKMLEDAGIEPAMLAAAKERK